MTNRPDGRKRVIIEGITPQVDCGRFPAKRTVGDQVRVEADIFTDGHDAIAASLLAHREGSDEWTEIPMKSLVNDRWEAAFRVSELGRYGYKVQGWVDHFETWRRDLLKRIAAKGLTILIIDHDMTLVTEVAQHITVLNFGRRIADGVAADVLRQPDVIAAYLGSEPDVPAHA